MTGPRAPIVVIEDSDEDYQATAWALRRAQVDAPIKRCTSGDAFLAWVNGNGAFRRPCLILLDLNLPGTDGRDLLDIIHRDVQLQSVPMVVLSTSSNPRDVALCYSRCASGYMVKPVDIEKFAEMIRCFADYWLKAVALPEG